MSKIRSRVAIPLILPLILIPGCSDPDARLSRLAEQSLENQAKQNDQMAKHSQAVSEASRELVAADAKARQEMITAQGNLQQELQSERSGLDRQHEDLEHERQQIAATRNRDPILAGAIVSAAVLLACALPILLCLFVVRALAQQNPDDAVGDLLVQELVADESLLLPRPMLPAIEHHSSDVVNSPAVDSGEL